MSERTRQRKLERIHGKAMRKHNQLQFVRAVVGTAVGAAVREGCRDKQHDERWENEQDDGWGAGSSGGWRDDDVWDVGDTDGDDDDDDEDDAPPRPPKRPCSNEDGGAHDDEDGSDKLGLRRVTKKRRRSEAALRLQSVKPERNVGRYVRAPRTPEPLQEEEPNERRKACCHDLTCMHVAATVQKHSKLAPASKIES